MGRRKARRQRDRAKKPPHCIVCYQECRWRERVYCRGHFTCEDCLSRWYKEDGSKTGRCPQCQCMLPGYKMDVKSSFPSSGSAVEGIGMPVDDRTQRWLNINAKQCPNEACGIWIKKDGGCNKVTCTSCDTLFCYGCGSWLSIDVRDCEQCSHREGRSSVLHDLFGLLLLLCLFLVGSYAPSASEMHQALSTRLNIPCNSTLAPSTPFCEARVNAFRTACNTTWPTASPVCGAFEAQLVKDMHELVDQVVAKLYRFTWDGTLEWKTMEERTKVVAAWTDLQVALHTTNLDEAKEKWNQWVGVSQVMTNSLMTANQKLYSSFHTYWSLRFGAFDKKS